MRHGAARPDVNAEQCKQQTQLQRVDQRHVRQRLGGAVTDAVSQPEPAEHQQRQRRGGIHAVFARISRYRPRPGTRRRHQQQIQARQNRPTQPAPGVVLLGQQQQAVTQLQGQHADQQPATEHMGGTQRARRQHRRQAPQGNEMHDEHRRPRQPAEIGRRVIPRMPGSRATPARPRASARCRAAPATAISGATPTPSTTQHSMAATASSNVACRFNGAKRSTSLIHASAHQPAPHTSNTWDKRCKLNPSNAVAWSYRAASARPRPTQPAPAPAASRIRHGPTAASSSLSGWPGQQE